MRTATVERIDSYGQWRYAWAGTAPFRLYQKGRLLDPVMEQSPADGATTNDTSRDFSNGDPYEPPQLEVLDSTDSEIAQNILYPGYLTLQWHEAPEAAEYRIDQKVGGAWSELHRIPSDGRGYYVFETPPLDDDTTYYFQVVPIMSTGVETPGIEFVVDFVTIPDPPAVELAVSAGTVTVSARS